jgi:hypothetical protein
MPPAVALQLHSLTRSVRQVRWLHPDSDPPNALVAPNQLSRIKHPLPRALLKAWIMHASTMQTFGKFTVRAVHRVLALAPAVRQRVQLEGRTTVA